MTFRLWRPGDPLVAGRFGLREPSAGAPEMRPKILFAPLLGFDAEGTRLGFGGGYYDATLARLRRERPDPRRTASPFPARERKKFRAKSTTKNWIS